MIKTFIYGVPKGFDYYERDSSMNDYFRGFYVSSRRGRRLMINRRENGETIYNYLRYGLREVERQPLNSFFGMSIVMDGFQYCPDFKILLDWFDFLFDKLVNERHVIKKDEQGIFYYTIQKFEENPSDVEWLKSNLPNIFSQAGQVRIASYDNSFIDGQIGQVMSFNQAFEQDAVLSAFKKYRWVSITSETIIPDRIELNYEELNSKLNDINQRLLPIAVNTDKGSLHDLKQMYEKTKEIHTTLSKYLLSTVDDEEKTLFKVLMDKYGTLGSSINTLLSKFNNVPYPPQPDKRFCSSCQELKLLSAFGSPEALTCLECQNKEKQKRYCISCRQNKPLSYFNSPDSVKCIECQRRERGFRFSNKIIALLLSLIVITGGFVAIRFSKKNTEVTKDSTSVGNDSPARKVGEVDDELLDNLLSSGNIDNIAQFVKDVQREFTDKQKESIKDCVNNHLISKLNGEIIPTENAIYGDIREFYASYDSLLARIGFGKADKKNISDFLSDYFFLWNLIQGETVSDKQKKEALTRLSQSPFNKSFPVDWKGKIENKPTAVAQDTRTSGDKYVVKLNDKEEKFEKQKSGVDVEKGTKITIEYPSNGGIESVKYKKNESAEPKEVDTKDKDKEGERTFTMTLSESGQYIIYLKNRKEITFTIVNKLERK